MKKIIFIVPSLAVGGLEKVQVNLANALADRGHDITVMVLENDYALADELSEKVKLIYKPYRKSIMKKIPYIRHRFYDDGMWETRASAKKLHGYYIGKEKYDVEIAFFRGMPVKIVSGAHTDFEKKSLCTHTLSARDNDFGEKSGYTHTLAWVHTDFEKATGYANNFRNMTDVFDAYKSFDKVICVSKQAEKSFKKVIGDTGNLTTIYNLTPVSKIRALSDENPEIKTARHKINTVLVARLLDSAKGQIRLISVISQLQAKGIDIGLTLVGDGPDMTKIEQFIKDNNAKNFVHLVGTAKNPYPYIKNSDLLICASFFEGYNLTVAEALICGTPVLSTDCTGPNEILDNGKYGMIVENSEQGLLAGLEKLATDNELLAKYKEKANERMPFFDEEKIVKQIEELF